ncbi:N-acetylmuramoyl-L-alanine amidase [Streptomyces sp. NPDC003032]
MRGFLASSIGVTCAAALALPLTLPSSDARAATPGTPPPAGPATEATTAETVPGTRTASGARTASAARTPSGTRAPSGAGTAPGSRTAPAARTPSGTQTAPGSRTAPAAQTAPGTQTAPAARTPPAAEAIPGSTQSLPLGPLDSDRSAAPAEREQGLARRDVRPFSLVGVVWDDPADELHGTVQVRTRASATATWSGWQGVETHNNEHGADPDAVERATGRVRGSTAPLWVGDSDGVEIRVRAEPDRHTDRAPTDALLPKGLRLELVDPGDEPPPRGGQIDVPRAPAMTAEAAAASAVNADLAPFGATAIPELTKQQTEDDLIAAHGGTEEVGTEEVGTEAVGTEEVGTEAVATEAAGTEAVGTEATSTEATSKARPYIGPRPRIITRKGWGADERIRERGFAYSKTVKAAFVHHSASGNNYRCSQAASVLRSIYRYHVKSSGWRDLGYNFAIDKCGNIYEGRAGGVAKPVLGAHTRGFNANSTGIAVLGSYSSANPPKAAVDAIARLTAWKLGLYGANPSGTTYLTSGGGNLYKKGTNVRLQVISGHRDGFATDCPGSRLYGKLDTIRTASARLQGR